MLCAFLNKKFVVRCKWIFKRKEGVSSNEHLRFNVRLVAKGFSKIPCIDYNDVFSLVVTYSCIRAFFGIVAIHDLELEQLDVKIAFLRGNLRRRYTWTNLKVLVCLVRRILFAS
jgi:hypothetical protein